jgi:thiamine kinase-like enzyme
MTEEAAYRLACDVFDVPEVSAWRVLKKGMTNRSYAFAVEDQKYIIRAPGEGTEKLINRQQEAEVYRAISGLGFCDDPIYINPDTGIKITKYLDGVRVCNPYDENDVRQSMRLLRRLHNEKLKVEHLFDLFGQIDFYEELREGRSSIYPDYTETKKKVLTLRKYIDQQEKDSCLAHIDAVCDNFLFCKDGLQLTDWEYAGMQDPHIDVAMFCVYSDYSRENIDGLIDIYFEDRCDDRTRVTIYCYIAACGLLWSNWCEYKHQLGVEFGDYALRQYRYARDYYKIAIQEMKKL